ncbi:MAG: ferritin-like domain-containing protein [Actinobacteria bacterium]|nr:ferritin-like domain-containing protein [Actinomycetota bacterium]
MLHNETFPGVKRVLEDFTANLAHVRSTDGLGRRAFLGGLGGAAIVGGLAACSSSGGKAAASGSTSTSASAPPSGSSSTGASKYTGDLKVVALAAALENLAVTAYGGAIKAAAAGKLGAVPPAVATFATTAMKQHQDHSQAWNGVLSKANLPTITGAPLSITAQQVSMLNSATSVVDVAKLALALENAAADTYTFATANVQDAGGIMTAATIQPVETMHAAILNYVLGQYPVPLSFVGVNQAVPPSALTV